MQSISEETEVDETILPDNNGYTKQSKIHSVNLAEQNKKQSAKLAEQIDSGMQDLRSHSAKILPDRIGENTFFADDIKEVKELKPVIELKPAESLSSKPEIQKMTKRWFKSGIQQRYMGGDISKAILEIWVSPCFVVGYNEQPHALHIGVMNSFAKDYLEGRELNKIIEREIILVSHIQNLSLEIVVDPGFTYQ